MSLDLDALQKLAEEGTPGDFDPEDFHHAQDDERGEGVCRTCLAPIWNEGGTVGGRRKTDGWSDRVERGGDSLVCFNAARYRHVPLVGREAAIYDRARLSGRLDRLRAFEAEIGRLQAENELLRRRIAELIEDFRVLLDGSRVRELEAENAKLRLPAETLVSIIADPDVVVPSPFEWEQIKACVQSLEESMSHD